ncbi:hypothetical protein AMTR_s00054p00179980 [Amborella trichopoda]|uniref:Uncharacterized protein n=1 Tax=Amborella trichopoda TaxID=13333 RepID=U5DCP9_AMBTC|nr:hypothetical protein AMTR_s00054p00179980 [Amborella trichopoda]
MIGGGDGGSNGNSSLAGLRTLAAAGQEVPGGLHDQSVGDGSKPMTGAGDDQQFRDIDGHSGSIFGFSMAGSGGAI